MSVQSSRNNVSESRFDRDVTYRIKGTPFTKTHRVLENRSDSERVVSTLSFRKVIGPATKFQGHRILGVDGLVDITKGADSHMFVAIAHPDGTNASVSGWLTQNRGSGSIHIHVDAGQLILEARLNYGRFVLKPGEKVITDAWVFASHPDGPHGLEDYADLIASEYKIKLPRAPSGYCSWYSSPHGGASDERANAELASFAGKHLKAYGFDTILTDDQWQGPSVTKGGIMGSGPTGNFTRHDPKGPYPSGMKANAANLAASGMRAGLWFMPFSWDPRDPLFSGHADWFVKKPDGSNYEVLWAGWCVDMTRQDTRAFLAETVKRITNDWGYRHLKPDAMWTGLASLCTYPGTQFVDDHYGDAVFTDKYATNLDAYRSGIQTMRSAAAPGTYIAACNVAQNFRSMGGAIGLVDAMRIGPDTGANWADILPNFHLGSRLYFFNHRVWHNDPDCLMLRSPLTVQQARSFASWVAVTGSLNLVSEWLPGLPDDRIECIKRSMPNVGIAATPLDVFENSPARVWEIKRGNRHVVGLFNFDAAKPASVTVPVERLGYKAVGTVIYTLDFWTQKVAIAVGGEVSATLPPCGNSVLSMRKVGDHPQLLGTSRHITQQFVDVRSESFDASTSTLTLELDVVATDPLKVTVLRRTLSGLSKLKGYQFSVVDVPVKVQVSYVEDGDVIRFSLSSPASIRVTLECTFAR
jgi:hypothetical protein